MIGKRTQSQPLETITTAAPERNPAELAPNRRDTPVTGLGRGRSSRHRSRCARRPLMGSSTVYVRLAGPLMRRLCSAVIVERGDCASGSLPWRPAAQGGRCRALVRGGQRSHEMADDHSGPRTRAPLERVSAHSGCDPWRGLRSTRSVRRMRRNPHRMIEKRCNQGNSHIWRAVHNEQ